METATGADAGPATDDSGVPDRVVAIGASAGGLEALQQLFATLPVDTGMAFVVVQHLSPDFKSLMPELLGRQTSLPVIPIDRDLPLRANHVYVLSAGFVAEWQGERLVALARGPEGETPNLPINRLFTSLAPLGSRLAVVVLSGTGQDGLAGARVVREAGGFVLAQVPGSARFDSMPRAVIEAGVADAVALPAEMGRALANWQRDPASGRRFTSDATDGETLLGGPYGPVLQVLQRTFDLDFNCYKSGTITRRIDRWLAADGPTATPAGLAAHLEGKPAEIDRLFGDLLIGVTRFFRDAPAFEAARVQALEAMVDTLGERDTLRVWCCGCSTGEEAYTLAMLAVEVFDRRGLAPRVRVLATDVHAASVQKASAGIYDEESLAALPLALRNKYFSATVSGHYRVTEHLRRQVVFSVQNVLRDAGFQRIDLVSCRNLLIYLRPEAQAQVLAGFHTALKPGGMLLLGTSEMPTEQAQAFEPVAEHAHLFRKRAGLQLTSVARTAGGLTTVRRPAVGTALDARASYRLQEVLAQRYVPAGYLVNQNDELVYIFGDAGRYLRAAPGRFGGTIFHLLDGVLRAAVTIALRKAAQGEATASMSGVVPDEHEPERRLRVDVDTVFDRTLPHRYYLVRLVPLLDELPRLGTSPAPESGPASPEHVAELEAELQRTREALQRSVEDLEAANEELQAGNEELMAANEELQSSNEELHALNEELYSVNAEHELKIQELRDTSSDLSNLIRASELPLIFLDLESRLRMFTPPATTLFPMRPSDVGRELRELVPREADPTLFEDLATVLAGREAPDRELKLSDGRNLRRRVTPYRTEQSSLGGLVITYTDATLQVRRREQQLDLEHQAQLRAIVESVPHLMWTCNADGDCDFLNPQWVNYTGVPAAAQLGRGWLEQVHAGDRADLAVAWAESVRTGRPIRTRFRIRRHDGAYRWFDTQGVPQLDDQGRVVKWFGSNTDVHEVAELERALGERDRFIQMVADNINAMVGYWDQEQVNRFANRHYLEWFGKTAEQVRGRTMREVLGDEVYAKNQPYIEAALRGQPQHFERTIVRPDGSTGHLLAEYTPHVVDGEVRGFVATATDISRVQEARLLTDQIFEVSPLAKLIIAADGMIAKWNPAAERLLGYAASELQGMKLERLVPPEYRQRHQRLQQVFLAAPERRSMGEGRSFPLLRADGTTVDVEIDLSGVSYNGRPAAIACVREVALSPNALRRLDLAIQSRNTFLAQMSHEIRTPLNAILGMAQLLELDRPTATQLDRLRRIEEASSHLLGIVNDVLDISKAEAGGLQLERERFELHALLDRSVAMVSEKARLKRLELTTEVAGDVPGEMVGDGRRVEQILVNLLSNAVKFTHHGRIDVRVSAAPAAGLRLMLRMEVADTGIGIAPDDLVDLFTPFRQVQQGHARRYGGTGLGLSICRQLARAMDGECGVQSMPGAGSTFWFQVMVDRAEAGPSGDPHDTMPMSLDPATHKPFAGRQVLVVEDNEVNRLVLHDLLAACTQVVVTEAEDGAAALEVARQRTFDAVLMDVQMPGIDGLETTRRMRLLPGYAQVPIFALTANVLASEVNECLAAGMDGHFGKPIMIDDVLRRLGEIWHEPVSPATPAGG